MSENVMDFAITDIRESRYFVRWHHCTKTDDNPLNGFRDSLTLSHGGGETVSYQLFPIMVTASVQPNHTLTISHGSNYLQNVHGLLLHIMKYIYMNLAI